jgi:hypothetical protein
MMERTQISLDPELRQRAKQRAAQLGVSLAEYIRRLLADDLEANQARGAVSLVFDLADSGGSDIASRKDEYLDEAFGARPGR